MSEIHGKSMLVRISARFELARVRVIGSQLYFTSVSKTVKIFTITVSDLPKNILGLNTLLSILCNKKL